LADPEWSVKAEKVKTLKEMQQVLLAFCRVKGNVMQIDKDTVYAFL